MKDKKIQRGEIVIYRSKDGKAELEVNLQEDTVWLDAWQIAMLFDVNRPAIVKHVQNIYKSAELKPNLTCSILEHVGADGRPKKKNLYNLDMIISVGYRVNSKRATQFRIWATSVLKEHILSGYTLNQKRLQEKGLTEFEEAVALIKRTVETKALSNDESKGLLEVITTYASTWVLLQKYDQDAIKEPKTRKAHKKFDYDFCRKAIDQIKSELMKKKEATDLFGNERGEQFKGIVDSIHQTFDKQDLYPSIEEKAAHVLYGLTKRMPLSKSCLNIKRINVLKPLLIICFNVIQVSTLI